MSRVVKVAVVAEDDAFVARCLDIEMASDGATEQEALSNLQQALELYFERDDVTISLGSSPTTPFPHMTSIQPLAVVRLRQDLPRGTIVEVLNADTVLVEFADERGQALECVPVPKILLEPEPQRLSMTSALFDVTAVQVLPGFTLRLTFENGEVRRYAMSRLLARESTAFTPLRKVALFRQAFIAHGTVRWPNGTDIDPELLYQQSVPESEDSLANALTEIPNVGEEGDFCCRNDGISETLSD